MMELQALDRYTQLGVILVRSAREMGFTGSISENRVYLAIPAQVRQALTDDARALGIKTAEFTRQLLIRWFLERENRE